MIIATLDIDIISTMVTWKFQNVPSPAIRGTPGIFWLHFPVSSRIAGGQKRETMWAVAQYIWQYSGAFIIFFKNINVIDNGYWK